MSVLLTTEAAAKLLGVTRQTLYAYISRGLLQPAPGAQKGAGRFRLQDIERLQLSRRLGKRPKLAAQTALDWGLPVLPSSLTLIDGGMLYYRGQAVTALLADQSVESVASLLWDVPIAPQTCPDLPATSEWLQTAMALEKMSPARRALVLFPLAMASCRAADLDGGGFVGLYAHVRWMLASLLGVAPQPMPLHQMASTAWRIDDPAGQGLIRQALILCADHELNASSFAARCVASTGASLDAALIGGLAALSGVRHGAATHQVESWWHPHQPWEHVLATCAQAMSPAGRLAGLGHPLYPNGDPRAQMLLSALPWEHEANCLARGLYQQFDEYPSVDFALVALCRYLGLPAGAAFILFAAGRTIGWLAHALEQRQDGGLIRPRAAYTGQPPAFAQTASPVEPGRIVRFR
ncbi:citrate synthase [Chitinivorax tropicus]|uniref:citrate synthase (unknown stereospecificity) n=1 Tax=Chitinivorax tropicus TaxID=714531 RepID=A0A840MMV8_9PROT|nr:citrate synthase family protein [Chitinivorax tropicus]MBB5017533.1 citrate synthase [Chitinivorax tropicus]